jgi:superfamily II DNA helicase RecQ
MQIKIFTLPVHGAEQAVDDLNKFLRSHRVLQTERHFCPENGGYWAILVEYLDKESVEEVVPSHRRERRAEGPTLDEEAQQRYDEYRAIRRRLATERSIPAYVIFTNEELAQLARLPEPLNEDSVKSIKGIAPSRLKENIHFFFTQVTDEAGRASDGADSRQDESA